MFGITIIFLRSSSSTSFSLADSSSIRAPEAATCFLTSSASSRFPCPISAPICLEVLFLSALSASTSCLISLFSLSSSITLSTSSSLLSWNLFLMFCFTISGFSLTNLMSNIISPPDSFSVFIFYIILILLLFICADISKSEIDSLTKCFYFFLTEHYIGFTFDNFFQIQETVVTAVYCIQNNT